MDNASSRRWWAYFLSDYGMIFVLLLLAGFLTVFTWDEQHLSEGAAAELLAPTLIEKAGAQARVLIVVRDTPRDDVFAHALRQRLEEKGVTVVGTVRGTPPEARRAIADLLDKGAQIDVFACNRPSSVWGIYEHLAKKYSRLQNAPVIRPESYRWSNFLTTQNLRNIADQIAIIAIMAVGMTMVIIAGGIDLSVGSLVALSAVLAARLLRDLAGGAGASDSDMVLCSLAAIGACGLVGLFNGIMVTQFQVPAFIVTLAVMMAASGYALMLADGQSIHDLPDTFNWLGTGAELFGIPNAVVLMVVLYALAHIVMTRMALGRYIYAVGGNPEAARLSGVPVRRVVWTVFTLSGLLAGLGGIVLASQLKSGDPKYGQSDELYVIAAVVVGGASLSGGKGKIFGTLIGAFIIAVIRNGMNLMSVTPFAQKVAVGAVILGAVLLDQLKRRWER